MKIGQIKKAAKAHQKKIPYCYGRDVRGKFVGNNYVFIAGAQWRINSVWHDASEVPERSGMCILIRQNGYPIFVKFFTNKDWKEFVECNKIEIWAFLSDLLPIPQNSGELKRKEVKND